MKPEAKLWNLLKTKTEPLVDWTRIEARVGLGIPDLNGVTLGSESKEFWLELKVSKTKRYSVTALWRPAQIAWQTKRSQKVRNVFNLVSHPSGAAYYLYSGDKLVRLITEGPLAVEPDLTMRGQLDVVKMINYMSNSDHGQIVS